MEKYVLPLLSAKISDVGKKGILELDSRENSSFSSQPPQLAATQDAVHSNQLSLHSNLTMWYRCSH